MILLMLDMSLHQMVATRSEIRTRSDALQRKQIVVTQAVNYESYANQQAVCVLSFDEVTLVCPLTICPGQQHAAAIEGGLRVVLTQLNRGKIAEFCRCGGQSEFGGIHI